MDTGAEHPSFEKFLAARGQSVLRLGYLVTGSRSQTLELTRSALSSVGARWRALRRDDVDPMVAVRVELARQYLRSPSTPDEVTAGTEDIDQRRTEILAMSPAERVLLVLYCWAESEPEEFRQIFGRRQPSIRQIDALDYAALRHAERDTPEFTADLRTAIRSQTTATLKRHRRWTVAAAAAAVVAGVLAVQVVRPAAPVDVPATQVLEWNEAWPQVQPIQIRAELSDGRVYWPHSVLDERTLVGVTGIRRGTEGVGELVLVDIESGRFTRLANFGHGISQVVVDFNDTTLIWAVRQLDEDVVRIWRSDRDGTNIVAIGDIPNNDGALQPITARLAADAVYVVVATSAVGAETYTVPLSGGVPRRLEELSNRIPLVWPWFSTVGVPGHSAVTTRNLFTGEKREGAIPAEHVGMCGPQWCISEPASRGQSNEPTMSVVNRLDGSQRRDMVLIGRSRIPNLQADRFLVTLESQATRVAVGDLDRQRLVWLPGHVRVVMPGSWLLWWDDSRERNLWFAVRMTDLAG